MKPTQEQVIAWAREICGPEMPEWRDGTEMEWHEFHALALRCYEAGRKDENEALTEGLEGIEFIGHRSLQLIYVTRTAADKARAAIRARREQ